MKKTIVKTAYSKSRVVKKTLKSKERTSPLKASLKKQYVKNNPACKVTFRLPKDAAPDAQRVTIVGDFNNWNVTETPMKRLKNGDFQVSLELPCNTEYSFRYLVNANRWENDWYADRYVPNPYGCEDSVVVV
jgi:1,4-alpha-glucan branching enzyme